MRVVRKDLIDQDRHGAECVTHSDECKEHVVVEAKLVALLCLHGQWHARTSYWHLSIDDVMPGEWSAAGLRPVRAC